MNCLHFLQTSTIIHSHHHCCLPLHSTTPTNLFLQPLHHCCKSKWDSNAESFNFNFKNTQNTNRYYYDNDDDDDDDEGSDGIEQLIEVLEEYIDSIWILKVFGSYGWFLPFIVISILLASGLKAFLMALALPLVQSTISFAYQKISGTEENRSRSKRSKMKTKKKSRARRSKAVAGKRGTKEKTDYQTWVPQSDVSTDKPNYKSESSFGGWDELDQERDFSRGSSMKSDPTIGRSRKTSQKEGKFSKIGRKSETPLLLRLLISVFPFLSSWTKML